MVFLAIFAVVAIKFSLSFGGNFRHLQQYASSGPVPLLYYSLKSYHLVALLVYSFERFSFKRDPLYCLIFAALIVVTVTGSFDAIYIFFALAMSVKGKAGVMSKMAFSIFKSKIMIVVVPLGLVIVAFVTKGGGEALNGIVSNSVGVLDLLVTRISHHSCYFSHFLSHPALWFEYWPVSTEILYDQTMRRAYILFGATYETESVQTVNRLNHLVFHEYSDKDSGSSPRVFGSVFLSSTWTYFLACLLVFLGHVFSLFDKIMGRDCKCSWIVYMYALVVAMSVISSPMSTLNVFGTQFGVLMLLILSSLRSSPKRS